MYVRSTVRVRTNLRKKNEKKEKVFDVHETPKKKKFRFHVTGGNFFKWRRVLLRNDFDRLKLSCVIVSASYQTDILIKAAARYNCHWRWTNITNVRQQLPITWNDFRLVCECCFDGILHTIRDFFFFSSVLNKPIWGKLSDFGVLTFSSSAPQEPACFNFGNFATVCLCVMCTDVIIPVLGIVR